MPLFDWIVTGSSFLATKTMETLVAEFTKKQIANKEKSAVLQKLINLYSGIGAIQAYSNEYVELLDTFIEKRSLQKKHFTNSNIKHDWRWFEKWSFQLDFVAISIASEMDQTIKNINEFGLGAEIYMPQVSEIMSNFKSFTREDRFIAWDIGSSIPFIHPKISKADGTDVDTMNNDELGEFSQKVKTAIESLDIAKKSIAEIIKKDFSLEQYMKLNLHDIYENNSIFSKSSSIERRKRYAEALFDPDNKSNKRKKWWKFQ